MLIIVPCGARKRPEPSRARELYIGAQFAMTWKAAEALKARAGGRIVILSGLHGLVEPDAVIAPYEQRMGRKGCVSVATLREQAGHYTADSDVVVVLAGKDYAGPAKEVWPHAETPLVGLGGIGYQRQALSRIMAAEHPNSGRS